MSTAREPPVRAIADTVWQAALASTLAITGLLAVGLGPAAIAMGYLAAVTPALVQRDITEHRLPNRLVLPGYAAALFGLAGVWLVDGRFPVLAIVSGAAYFAFLLVLNVMGGMGMGDVKLAGAIGLAAGLVGLMPAIVSPVLAFVAGGVVSVVALAAGRRAARIPFGPFMLLGFWVAVAVAG